MLAVPFLLLASATAAAAGVSLLLAGPSTHASLNPGNELMTASNYTFLSDTFSAAGSIGSVAGDPGDPVIVTGRWNLDVQGGVVSSFSASLVMVNASGKDYRTVELSNLTPSGVIVNENGTALVKGTVDLTAGNGSENLTGVDVEIALARLRALNITLSEPPYLSTPIYGIADMPKD
ncbi:MAG TPA: hypothetical protein VNI77_05905 [Nitrososphaera sp.]|nr:hypothetical protein [Nitrososphaera sp.]